MKATEDNVSIKEIGLIVEVNFRFYASETLTNVFIVSWVLPVKFKDLTILAHKLVHMIETCQYRVHEENISF